jgi:hypothetical protein
MPSRSRLPDLAALFALTLIGLVFGLGRIHFRPDMVYNLGFLSGEDGNQLYRADRLARGYRLYRDIASPYGPIGAYSYAGYAAMLGNTMAANRYWHLGWSLMCIGMAYCVIRRAVGMKAGFALTLGLALPMMLQPGGMIAPFMNFEHLSLERACLLGLMLLWRPPPERRSLHAVGMGLILGLWQGIKFGGAFFGAAAVLLVDLLWLYLASPARVRPATASTQRGVQAAMLLLLLQWAWLLGSFALVELGWIAIAFATLPLPIAGETIWPAYMAELYQSITWSKPTWLKMRYFPLHQILPLLCMLLAASGLVLLRRARADAAASATSADSTHSQLLHETSASSLPLWVGVFFYLLGSVAYFGHVYHYYQYAWALAPAAAWGFCRLAPGFRFLAAVATIPVWIFLTYHTFLAGIGDHLAAFPLPNGEQVYVERSLEPELQNLVRVTEAANRKDGSFVVCLFDWGGGGWHYFYNRNYSLRNILVAPISIRPFDEEELRRQLPRVEALIVEVRKNDEEDQRSPKAVALAELRATCSPALFQLLAEEFDLEPRFAADHFAIFGRHPVK